MFKFSVNSICTKRNANRKKNHFKYPWSILLPFALSSFPLLSCTAQLVHDCLLDSTYSHDAP